MSSNNILNSKDDYVSSIEKLFPTGEYWDKQFSDENSDLSLWVKVLADELYLHREKYQLLLKESNPQTSTQMLDDWERILLGQSYPHLDLVLRRKLLVAKRNGFVNKGVLGEIAEAYGGTIKQIYFPYRSAFVGHTRIGINRICSPASFSLLFIESEINNQDLKADFEKAIETTLLAHYIVKFFYN